MTGDQYFNGMAERYRRRIYGGPKGEIRMGIVWDDLLEGIPGLVDGPPLNILDAGGGQGQMSIRLARQGHRVVLAEPSADMLAYARRDIEAAGVEDRVTLVRAPVQELDAHLDQRFDLVVCHAVLEWLADPAPVVPRLTEFLAPGGSLSLMYYNARATVFRSLLWGDFGKIRSGELGSRRKKRFTPITPLEPESVDQWLEQAGLDAVLCSGIRTFYDYMPRESRELAALDEVLEMERRFSRQDPYRWLGRYIHVLCRLA